MTKSESITISSGPLALEAVLTPGQGPTPSALVVVCHPHPLYGGDMDSHVVRAICREMHRQNVATLRFNFRGVGQSRGTYDGGKGESDDLGAALSRAEELQNIDPDRIGVVGYSFGAGVAIAVAAGDTRVKALAAISAPVVGLSSDDLQCYQGPTLLASGSNDQFAPSEKMQELAKSLGSRGKCLILEGEDHFWGLRVEEMAQAVAEFFAAHLL